MSGYVPSKKSLFTSHIDVGSADRMYSARHLLKAVPEYCSNPAEFIYDEYGRLANPYSLRMKDPCNALSEHHNINAFLQRENAERPFIPFAFPDGAKQRYDTMGIGRDMIGSEVGGSDGKGGWHHVNTDRKPRPSCSAPRTHNMSDPYKGGMSLAPMFLSRYTN